MAKPGRKSEKEQVASWLGKIGQGDGAYKKWASKYQVERFENFYQGIQWEVMGETSDANISKYVINLYFSAIETKKPSLLFYHPHYSVAARPTREEDSQSNADGRALLRQDVLNTFVGDSKLHFKDKTSLCLMEALFTFAVVEVGYTADFIDNPQAGKPVVGDDGKDTDTIQPEKIPSNERLFLKRIPSKTFRVPLNSKNQLEENDWCGYYEYHYPKDLKANPNYSNTSSIQATSSIAQDSVPGDFGGKTGADARETEDDKHRDMVKVWKIWDNRSKERLVFIEGGQGFLLRKKFKFLPFADLKFIERLDEYLPFPLTYNWIWPQQEVNDIAEAERIHRQRFKRKFVRTASLTEGEAAKLMLGDDGVCVEAAQLECIKPVEDAPLDSAVRISRADSKSDFNEVSSVTNEMRGVSETQTATQSNILDTRARIRESLERVEVGGWLAAIGRLILMTVEEYMALPFWVKTVVDPLSMQAPVLAKQVEATWREITSEDLGDIDYDVSVDIDSLSPSTEMQTQQAWNQFLQQVMTNPILIQLFALSPQMLHRTATLNGIKNAKDLQMLEVSIAQMAQAMAQAALAAQQAKAGGTPGQAAPGPTPGLQDIQSQLQSQMPQPGIPQ